MWNWNAGYHQGEWHPSHPSRCLTGRALVNLCSTSVQPLPTYLKYCHISNAKNNHANAINTWICLLFSYGIIDKTVRCPNCSQEDYLLEIWCHVACKKFQETCLCFLPYFHGSRFLQNAGKFRDRSFHSHSCEYFKSETGRFIKWKINFQGSVKTWSYPKRRHYLGIFLRIIAKHHENLSRNSQ